MNLKPDFRFKLNNVKKTSDTVSISPLVRFMFRYVCTILWRKAVKERDRHYPFFELMRSEDRSGLEKYRYFRADIIQVIRMLLVSAGYDCSVSMVMDRCGISYGDFLRGTEYNDSKVWEYVDSSLRRGEVRR